MQGDFFIKIILFQANLSESEKLLAHASVGFSALEYLFILKPEIDLITIEKKTSSLMF